MGRVKIYIASSWRNQHAVEMLTMQLRSIGCEVKSWVENNYGETHNHVTKQFTFAEWFQTEQADRSFEFDSHGAADCDVFIYIAPAGKDAMAEMGICYGQRFSGRTAPIYALWAKGEDLGLMHKMIDRSFDRYLDLLEQIKQHTQNLG